MSVLPGFNVAVDGVTPPLAGIGFFVMPLPELREDVPAPTGLEGFVVLVLCDPPTAGFELVAVREGNSLFVPLVASERDKEPGDGFAGVNVGARVRVDDLPPVDPPGCSGLATGVRDMPEADENAGLEGVGVGFDAGV